MREDRLQTEIVITPKQRRHIQLIQLEILLEVDRICRKHQIEYRLTGGTLIGAVRHQGFVPWDPDADIAMYRSDYNRFFEVCERELDQGKFFLQEWRTDSNYRWNYARMLREGTEFVRAGHEALNTKNGIFIDIICTDRVPDSKWLRPLHCLCCFMIRKMLWSKVGKTLHPHVLMRKWYLLLSLLPRDGIFKFRDWVISWSEDKPTDLYRNMAHKVSPKSLSRWGYPGSVSKAEMAKVLNGERPWNDFIVDLKFEGYQLMASKFYEQGLRNTFGDYMRLPPKEQRKSHIPCSRLKLVVPDLPNFNQLMENVYID